MNLKETDIETNIMTESFETMLAEADLKEIVEARWGARIANSVIKPISNFIGKSVSGFIGFYGASVAYIASEIPAGVDASFEWKLAAILFGVSLLVYAVTRVIDWYITYNTKDAELRYRATYYKGSKVSGDASDLDQDYAKMKREKKQAEVDAWNKKKRKRTNESVEPFNEGFLDDGKEFAKQLSKEYKEIKSKFKLSKKPSADEMNNKTALIKGEIRPTDNYSSSDLKTLEKSLIKLVKEDKKSKIPAVLMDFIKKSIS